MVKKKAGTKPKKAAKGQSNFSKQVIKSNLTKRKSSKVVASAKKKPIAKKPTSQKPSDASAVASSEAIKKFMDAVRIHLSRHCVLLACAPKGTKGFQELEFATGFLLGLAGRKLIVTAGHWAEKVRAWKESGTLEVVLVSYTRVSEDLTTKAIPSEAVSSKILRIADDFDAAVLIPSDELMADIEAQGNHYFTEGHVIRGAMSSPHLVIVCGYPVQGTIITRSPAFYSKSDGQTFQHDKVSLGSFAFQSTLLCPKDDNNSIFAPGVNCDADEFAFRPMLGKINSRPESGVTSAKGMSGGPVVAVVADPKDGEALFKPKLLGVQSSQKSIVRRDEVMITQLDVVGARRLLEWIKAILAQA